MRPSHTQVGQSLPLPVRSRILSAYLQCFEGLSGASGRIRAPWWCRVRKDSYSLMGVGGTLSAGAPELKQGGKWGRECVKGRGGDAGSAPPGPRSWQDRTQVHSPQSTPVLVTHPHPQNVFSVPDTPWPAPDLAASWRGGDTQLGPASS